MVRSIFNINLSFFLLKKCFHSSPVFYKVYPKSSNSKSSFIWLTRHLNDAYVKQARYKNYRARSAFKLLEINEENKILKPGLVIIDCGASPGSWSQVLVEKCFKDPKTNLPHPDTFIIGTDIGGINIIEGVNLLPFTDFTQSLAQSKIINLLDGRLVDLIVSDMAPNATGLSQLDHYNIVRLAVSVIQFSVQVLKPQYGNLLYKLWDGNETTRLLKITKQLFKTAKIVKPPASRCDSAEIYILAKEFKGVNK